ncbi:MAG: YihA family ribosome biogenesis GTP-binding protein [Cytophagales bacterium]|nr:YihA family ribosome biogenesis GTP-binding protein [Cytophagales bacterium]
MKIKKAEYLCSNIDPKLCPKPVYPEYAFIGRSNVGKSSLINLLVNTHLAKTSKTPGKTQLINHFLIDDNWFLVDLPGYGWAKVSKQHKQRWTNMIKKYLLERENLQCVFVLIDSRIPAQRVDLEYFQWLGLLKIPFVIVFTKIDKQSKSKTLILIDNYVKTMLKTWEKVPEYFLSSTRTEAGKKELLEFIHRINEQCNEKGK